MARSLLKIAVTGPFTDINFGDYAMLVNNAYDLGANNLLLFSYDKSFLGALEKDYFQNFNIKIAETVIKDGMKDIFSTRKNLTPFDLLEYVSNLDEITQKLSEVDVLLVNGGGYFNGLWALPHRIERLTQIIIPILVASRLNKKIIFSGNGFGPFDESSEFFACLFGALKNIKFSCRDNLYSPIWLRQLGVSDDQLDFIPDDLLLINENLTSFPTSFVVNAKDYIVLETYLPVEFIEENIEFFIVFSNKMYDDYGLHIVFLPFHLANGGADQGRLLSQYLDKFEFVDISEKGYLPIQDAVKIIENAKLVISNRYHAVVLSLKCATPTVSVLKDVIGDKRYYYNKNRGVLDQVLNGTYVNEKFYFCSDYLIALDYVANNFLEIISHQNKNYESVHSVNINKLSQVRSDFINSF